MKKKSRKPLVSKGLAVSFDETEFLLLVFVALVLVIVVGLQTHTLPKFLTDSLILGASTIR